MQWKTVAEERGQSRPVRRPAFGRVGCFVLSLMFGGGAKSLTHLYKYARACAYFWGPVKRLSLQPPRKTEKTRGGQACGARHAHGAGLHARAHAHARKDRATGGERRGDPAGEEDAT